MTVIRPLRNVPAWRLNAPSGRPFDWITKNEPPAESRVYEVAKRHCWVPTTILGLVENERRKAFLDTSPKTYRRNAVRYGKSTMSHQPKPANAGSLPVFLHPQGFFLGLLGPLNCDSYLAVASLRKNVSPPLLTRLRPPGDLS